MDRTETRLQGYLAEYGETMHSSASDEQILHTLVAEHQWTEEGAAHLLKLVHEYGSFVLGNAYALAVTLGIEDGDAGL